MTQSHATALVIGAGFGGLAAAMRLGTKGYRVTVVDRLDTPGGRGTAIVQNGHRFDLGPSTIRDPKALRDLWAVCGRDFDTDIDLRPLDPLYQIRWPDGSYLSVRQSVPAMRAEIARFAPDDLKGYDQFVQDCEDRARAHRHDGGQKTVRPFRDLLNSLQGAAPLRPDRSIYAHAATRVKDERLRMALSFHTVFAGGDPFRVGSTATHFGHLERAQGYHYAIGGTAAIAKAMAQVIEEQGGTLRFEEEVDEILFRRRQACGVRLTDGTEIAADIVISNADAGHTQDRLLRRRSRPGWARQRTRRTRSAVSLFVWHFGTHSTRQKWFDVGQHTVLNHACYRTVFEDIHRNGRVSDHMMLYLHRPSVTDPTVAPTGGDTFYAMAPVPHLAADRGSDWEAQHEPFRQRVSDLLEDQLLPGLGAHLTASEVFTPLDFRDRYLSPYGAGFSASPGGWQPAKGLYFVGAGTHPGAGMPGVLSSAEALSRLVPAARPEESGDAIAAE